MASILLQQLYEVEPGHIPSAPSVPQTHIYYANTLTFVAIVRISFSFVGFGVVVAHFDDHAPCKCNTWNAKSINRMKTFMRKSECMNTAALLQCDQEKANLQVKGNPCLCG